MTTIVYVYLDKSQMAKFARGCKGIPWAILQSMANIDKIDNHKTRDTRCI